MRDSDTITVAIRGRDMEMVDMGYKGKVKVSGVIELKCE